MSNEPTNPADDYTLDADAMAEPGELRIVVKVTRTGPDLQTSCNIKLTPAALGYVIGCAEGAARSMLREVISTAEPPQREPVAHGHAKGFAWAVEGDDWRSYVVPADASHARRTSWGPYVAAMEKLREAVTAYRELAYNPSGGIVDILNATNESAHAMFEALDEAIKTRPAT